MKQIFTIFLISYSLSGFASETYEFAFDPVLYVTGQEQAGNPELSTIHFNTRYLFTSAENRERFLANPSLYEAQFGGACARMGALSGMGRPSIHARFDEKLYFFASEGCRSTFLKNPSAALDPDAPGLEGSDAQFELGKQLLEQVVKAQGGPQFIDNLKNVEYQETRIGESNGKKTKSVHSLLQTMDGRIRYQVDIEPDYVWGAVLDGTQGFVFVNNDVANELHPQGIRELQRNATAFPLALLQARHRPGFQALVGSESNRDGKACRELHLAYEGMHLVADVGVNDHLIYALSYRGRGPNLLFGPLTLLYSGHDPSHANLPTQLRSSFGGSEPGDRLDLVIKTNQTLNEATFQTP